MRGIRNFFSRFMEGRYGLDKLNNTLLWTSVIIVIVTLFLPFSYVRLGLMIVAYLIMGWALFRYFSRNTYKRYRENRRFLIILEQLKDRNHRYYNCPRCRQPVRVPRGKGKIAITCPKCREKFIKKT